MNSASKDVSVTLICSSCTHIKSLFVAVLRLLRKVTDSHMYPTNLELLRVHLATTVFSDDIQNLLTKYKDDVSVALGIGDLDPLLVYLQHFWELLQLNNSVTIT